MLGESLLKCFNNRNVILYQKKPYASAEHKVQVFTARLDFRRRVIFPCIHVNFTRVNVIEALYERLHVNVTIERGSSFKVDFHWRVFRYAR